MIWRLQLYIFSGWYDMTWYDIMIPTIISSLAIHVIYDVYYIVRCLPIIPRSERTGHGWSPPWWRTHLNLVLKYHLGWLNPRFWLLIDLGLQTSCWPPCYVKLLQWWFEHFNLKSSSDASTMNIVWLNV